jgi:hypothetical protein
VLDLHHLIQRMLIGRAVTGPRIQLLGGVRRARLGGASGQ